jgi:hypothetical protein
VTRYEGSIWYEDVEGGGAQFHFKLPKATWVFFYAVNMR